MDQEEMMPAAFMSYVHREDEYYGGFITKLCQKLSAAICLQTGSPFKIFYDRTDIGWGENWRERIIASINNVTFFIPVVTPSYLTSEECRKEFIQFLNREDSLGRRDLIFPIYWRGKQLEDPEMGQEYYDLIKAIKSHQWIDWRELRYSQIGDPNVLRQIDVLAEHIERALRRTENTARSRSQGESAVYPRGMAKGLEHALLGHFFYSAHGSDDPRFLLETAMMQKKEGNYQAAKELHEKMLGMGIDWSHDVSLFVDEIYFAISLHDKLEEWTELDALERHVFLGAFKRIKPLLTPDAYNTVLTMYQSSMALSMLRQLRISDAQKRIDEVLANVPEPQMRLESLLPESIASARILYANALMTRALVLHAKWSLFDHDRSDLLSARADMDAAETIYRKFARMGEPDEFHHLGRFYGTRAFLRIAEWENCGAGETLEAEELLDDAQRAHLGENRTAYGRVAGQYCEAYCHLRLSQVMNDAASKQAHLDSALNLLKSAREKLDQHARLACVKITGLAAKIATLSNFNIAGWDANELTTAHQHALEELGEWRNSMFARVSLQKWLETPLN